METRANYILIGCFTLAVILSAFGFVYWFHHVGGTGDRTTYRVVFQGPIGGLRSGASVTFNGIRVGEVTDLSLDPKDPKQALATISINSDTPVRADTEISRDAITVGGLTVTASIEFSTSSGLLRVVGESHYQENLRKARAMSPDAEPVFGASLIPEPDNPYDPNAVKVAIDPFGTVGYLARESARRYGPLIAAAKSTAVRCPCKLTGGSGEKLFIGAVVDVAMSEGARLTSWRPDEKVDYDAIAKYHEMRNATLKFVTDTRPMEKSDATKAIERYSEAIARVRECEHFAADRRLFPLIEPGCNGNEVGENGHRRPPTTVRLMKLRRRSDEPSQPEASPRDLSLPPRDRNDDASPP